MNMHILQSTERILKSVVGLSLSLKLKSLRINLPYMMKKRFGGEYHPNTFFFVIAPNVKHPGLADRMKAIVNCYQIAKKNGYDFRIIFDIPFKLSDYLEPCAQDWRADLTDLRYRVGKTLFFDERRMITEDSWKGHTTLKKGKEYHCYSYVGNRYPKVFPESGYEWSKLYAELFKPTLRLNEAIAACGFQDRSYIAVHLRFVNALENFEEVSCCDNSLDSEEKKQDLIRRCKEALLRIKNRHADCRILVFSDSKRFLNSLEDMPVETLDSGNIGHVSFGTNDDATLKTFLDLYMISRAQKVYRIDAPELYAWSGFALTASMIGGIEFLTEKA